MNSVDVMELVNGVFSLLVSVLAVLCIRLHKVPDGFIIRCGLVAISIGQFVAGMALLHPDTMSNYALTLLRAQFIVRVGLLGLLMGLIVQAYFPSRWLKESQCQL